MGRTKSQAAFFHPTSSCNTPLLLKPGPHFSQLVEYGGTPFSERLPSRERGTAPVQ